MNSPILTGLRVLIVEDEQLVAMLIEDFLDELGCKVVGPASTVAETLALIETAQIDLALLDLNLRRGETTYSSADALAARSIPFAFVTGLTAQSLEGSYKGSPTLQKPFRMEDLERVLIDLAASRSN
jgi:CheY-like chemotaxis protein